MDVETMKFSDQWTNNRQQAMALADLDKRAPGELEIESQNNHK